MIVAPARSHSRSQSRSSSSGGEADADGDGDPASGIILYTQGTDGEGVNKRKHKKKKSRTKTSQEGEGYTTILTTTAEGQREGQREGEPGKEGEPPETNSTESLTQRAQSPLPLPLPLPPTSGSGSSSSKKDSASPSTPSTSAGSGSGSGGSGSGGEVWTRLAHLQTLLDQSLIDRHEFERRKQQLVDELTGTKLKDKVVPTVAADNSDLPTAPAAVPVDVNDVSVSNARRSKPRRTDREIESIALVTAAAAAAAAAASGGADTTTTTTTTTTRHFTSDISNNHLLMSHHTILPRPPPDFSAITAEPAIVHIFDLDTSRWSREPVQVKIDPNSFARGSLRLAYHMTGLQQIEKSEREKQQKKEIEKEKQRLLLLQKNSKKNKGKQPATPTTPTTTTATTSTASTTATSPTSSSALPVVDVDEINHHTYVAKISIDPYEERESYFQDVVMQHYARAYAQKYNSYHPPKQVHFLTAWLLELTSRPNKPLCAVEIFINGIYRKHNNNFGYVSEDERYTPQAFSHFTWEASNHHILICDIQGVGDDYTDPQIHSIDGQGFGKGNMGDRGVEKFIASHRCNAICRYLKLPPLNSISTTTNNNNNTSSTNNSNSTNRIEEDGSGTIPATQFMSYQSVDVININITGAVIDPFNAQNHSSNNNSNSNTKIHHNYFTANLPPLLRIGTVGGGAGRNESSSKMTTPLLSGNTSSASPARSQSPLGNRGGRESSSSHGTPAAHNYQSMDKNLAHQIIHLDDDTTAQTRCTGWCCIL